MLQRLLEYALAHRRTLTHASIHAHIRTHSHTTRLWKYARAKCMWPNVLCMSNSMKPMLRSMGFFSRLLGYSALLYIGFHIRIAKEREIHKGQCERCKLFFTRQTVCINFYMEHSFVCVHRYLSVGVESVYVWMVGIASGLCSGISRATYFIHDTHLDVWPYTRRVSQYRSARVFNRIRFYELRVLELFCTRTRTVKASNGLTVYSQLRSFPFKLYSESILRKESMQTFFYKLTHDNSFRIHSTQ